LRVAELTGLDVVASTEASKKGRGWIDLQGAEVMVQGKGGKRRTVPLGQAALKALELWLPMRSQALGMMTIGAGLVRRCAGAFSGAAWHAFNGAVCVATAQTAQFVGRHGHASASAHVEAFVC
jgi:site-specific recombinase XerD